MNVIIVTRAGIMDTPILVKDDNTAQATFESIAEDLLGEDVSEVKFISDSCLDEVNRLLKGSGVEVNWFVDLEVNNYG